MKLRILRGGMYADCQGGPIDIIKCILARERQRKFSDRRGGGSVVEEAEIE